MLLEFNQGLLKTEFVDLNSITQGVRKIVDALYRAHGFHIKIAIVFMIAPDLTTKLH